MLLLLFLNAVVTDVVVVVVVLKVKKFRFVNLFTRSVAISFSFVCFCLRIFDSHFLLHPCDDSQHRSERPDRPDRREDRGQP